MKPPLILIGIFLLVAVSGQQIPTARKQTQQKSLFTSSSKFCQRYNCECPDANREIKCRLNSTIREVDFRESDVQRLDLSDNSLEAITWGDTTLNLRELILRNNNLSVIHELMFAKVPHLHLLDLSSNRISELKEEYFTNLNVLEKLNLSRAFAADYRMSTELCELVSLKIVDLSYLDLGELKLDCWRTSPHLVEIHLRYTRNVDASAQNWLPIVLAANSTLRLIDLTGSDLKKIDLSLWLNANSLVSLSLSHNPNIDKNSIVELLKSTSIMRRLKYLHVANISADARTFPIDQVIKDLRAPVPLELLDISFNRFATDLNKFLFNQLNLTSLVVFNARGNRFTRCDTRLVMGERQTSLRRLEQLDLSYNFINDTSCLYSIRPISTLRYLDLSYNRISSDSNSQVRNFASIFALMSNLTYIDLAYNNFTWLVLYFNTNLTRIENLDVSNNQLVEFQVLSLTMLRNQDFPHENKRNNTNDSDEEIDELLNMQYIDEEDARNDAEDNILEAGKNKPDEDDERFVLIERLDLSANKFVSLNFQLMFQSIKNIVELNMSSNPLEQLIAMSFGAWPYQMPVPKNSTLIYPMNVQDEILCVDNLDLSYCKIHRIPSLAHACINTIDLRYNLISNYSRLAVSNYTLYFLDRIDLRYNNITKLYAVTVGQKFVQDDYKVQNSPINYFYGRTNTTRLNHTLVDVRNNPYFKCDCALIRTFKSIGSVRIQSECVDDNLIAKCAKSSADGDNDSSPTTGARQLNKRLKLLFAVTCIFLIFFSLIIIYYMCSDFFGSVKPYERMRVNVQRWWARSPPARMIFTSGSGGSSGGGMVDKNIGVKYTELKNDPTSVSQIEINNT